MGVATELLGLAEPGEPTRIMSEFWDAALLLVMLLGSSAIGLFTRPLLPEQHRSRETIELIQLVVTMLLTFAALVLGLLTTSAKDSFDTVSNDMRGFAAGLIQLDQSLREYGPETASARALLRSYTAAAIATTWIQERSPAGDYYPKELPRTSADAALESSTLGDMLARIDLEIRQLAPQDMRHRELASDCLRHLDRVTQKRWKLIEEAHSSISMPFYLVLVFWLLIVFTSFGLSTPRNALSYLMILLGALSIASAIFVILDMDTPFVGILRVSSQPMRDALAHMNR
jgi:hypothetical protein